MHSSAHSSDIADSWFWSTLVCPGRPGNIHSKRLDQFVPFTDVYSYENWNYINFIPQFILKILQFQGQNLFWRWPGTLNYTHLKKTKLLLHLIMPTSKPRFSTTSQLVLEILGFVESCHLISWDYLLRFFIFNHNHEEHSL